MQRVFTLGFVLLMFVLPAMAQDDEVPLIPKAPSSASEAKALIAASVSIAKDIRDNEQAVSDIGSRMTKVQALVRVHNGQYGGGNCTFPKENPSVCDPWIKEGKALNSQIAYLNNENEQAIIVGAELRAHFHWQLSKLRIMALMNGLQEFEQQTVACSKMKNDLSASVCMIAAWEKHP